MTGGGGATGGTGAGVTGAGAGGVMGAGVGRTGGACATTTGGTTGVGATTTGGGRCTGIRLRLPETVTCWVTPCALSCLLMLAWAHF